MSSWQKLWVWRSLGSAVLINCTIGCINLVVGFGVFQLLRDGVATGFLPRFVVFACGLSAVLNFMVVLLCIATAIDHVIRLNRIKRACALVSRHPVEDNQQSGV